MGLGWPPNHAIMAICDVGSHHDLEGVVRGLLIPHTCGEPSTSAHLHKSWEVGASASGAWDLGGLPIMPSWPFAMWGAIMTLKVW